MPDHVDPGDANKALFMNLVFMLSSSALQQLGHMPGPDGSPAEVNLEGAQVSIDMLDMLKAKTSGNLDAAETSMLEETLSSLQMAYFQAAQGAGEGGPESAAARQPAAEEPAPENAPRQTPGASADGEGAPATDAATRHEPRFHKSYGG